MRALFDAVAVRVTTISEAMAIASKALENSGKDCRSVQLNMGDCFAYAVACAYRAPLVFRGDDVSRKGSKLVKI